MREERHPPMPETTGRPGPLAGVRVIEMAGLGPAPYAAMLLAELGADVLRLDRPGGGGPIAELTEALNRSRPCVAVDLKRPGAAEAVLDLLAGADVLIEGLRPGVMERLGLGPDAALARNPRLVYGRMTGWGQDGPRAQEAGHDLTYAALTGALHAIGPAEHPVPPLNLVADFGGGSLFLVVGVLAALHARTGTGAGQVVDAAMVDGAASLMTMIYGLFGGGAWRDERGANLLDGGRPFYRTYRCRDGGFVAVGALEPEFFAALIAGLGLTGRVVGGRALPDGQHEPELWPEHERLIAEAFAGRDRDAWAAAFAGTDACVVPVLALREAPTDPHLRSRGTFVQVGGRAAPGVAPRFSGTPTGAPTPPRPAGADTLTALAAWGVEPGRIEAWRRDGIVVQA